MEHAPRTHAARRGPPPAPGHTSMRTRVHCVRAHSRRSAASAERDLATAHSGPLLLQQPGALNTHSASRVQGSPSSSTTVVRLTVDVGASLAAALVDVSAGVAIAAASTAADCAVTTVCALAAASGVAATGAVVEATGSAEIDDRVALQPNDANTLIRINTRIASR